MQPHSGRCNQWTIKLPSSDYMVPQGARHRQGCPPGPKPPVPEVQHQAPPWMQGYMHIMYRGHMDPREMGPGAKWMPRKHRFAAPGLVDVGSGFYAPYWPQEEPAYMLYRAPIVAEPLVFQQPATLVGTLTPWRDVNQTLAPPNLTTYGPSSPVEEEDRDSLSAYERDEEHQQLYDPPHQQPQHPHPHQLQGWSSDDLAPYQDDTAGINGQGDGDTPLGGAAVITGAEGPDVLLEEQDEVIALLIEVDERHEKQLAFERLLQERDTAWHRRRAQLAAASSDSVDVILDASLWRSLSDNILYDSTRNLSLLEETPTPIVQKEEILPPPVSESVPIAKQSPAKETSDSKTPDNDVAATGDVSSLDDPTSSKMDAKEKTVSAKLKENPCSKRPAKTRQQRQGPSEQCHAKSGYDNNRSSYARREYHSKRYNEYSHSHVQSQQSKQFHQSNSQSRSQPMSHPVSHQNSQPSRYYSRQSNNQRDRQQPSSRSHCLSKNNWASSLNSQPVSHTSCRDSRIERGKFIADDHSQRVQRSSLPYCCRKVNPLVYTPTESELPAQRHYNKHSARYPTSKTVPRSTEDAEIQMGARPSRKSEVLKPKRQDKHKSETVTTSVGSRRSSHRSHSEGSAEPHRCQETVSVGVPRRSASLRMFWEKSSKTISQKQTP